ncbi:hypothetical protein KAR91_11505 [Candidatus Pacearchaeota archaeon]|nr:hypothetical protein [Candidatus Pacearchaeota archaeon]
MDIARAEKLLLEYDEHRDAIKVMIKDLEDIKGKIDTIIPTTLEARYVRFFEEKIKTITSLFSTLLEMRKEIARSVREEIEIRRKMEKSQSEFEIEDFFDVRDLADKVDEFKKQKEKLREDIKKKDLTDYTNINIPGVTERIQQ